MTYNYDDIIDHPRYISGKRSPMTPHDRAAQFSPFAALTGYDEEIDETARRTDTRLELTEDQADELNKAFRKLSELDYPLIAVTYFVPDICKTGGAYVTYKGNFRFLDILNEKMKFTDGMAIPLNEIYSVEFLETELS